MSKLLIAPAELQDIEEIREIYNEAVRHSTAVYDEKERSYETQLKWFHDKQAAALPVLVAKLDSAVVGFCTYGPFRAWSGYASTVEHSVYVSPQHRAKGIGRELMQHLIQEARTNSFHVMIGGIDADNEASIRMHEKFGFTKAGYLNQVGRKFDRWLDLVLMELILG